MEREYKTLIFKKQSPYKCRYAVVMENEIYESGIPLLQPMTASMEEMQKAFPSIDLSELRMITIKVIDNE